MYPLICEWANWLLSLNEKQKPKIINVKFSNFIDGIEFLISEKYVSKIIFRYPIKNQQQCAMILTVYK